MRPKYTLLLVVRSYILCCIRALNTKQQYIATIKYKIAYIVEYECMWDNKISCRVNGREWLAGARHRRWLLHNRPFTEQPKDFNSIRFSQYCFLFSTDFLLPDLIIFFSLMFFFTFFYSQFIFYHVHFTIWSVASLEPRCINLLFLGGGFRALRLKLPATITGEDDYIVAFDV